MEDLHANARVLRPLAQAAAQDYGSHPGRAGAPVGCSVVTDPQARIRRAPPLAADRRAAGGLPAHHSRTSGQPSSAWPAPSPRSTRRLRPLLLPEPAPRRPRTNLPLPLTRLIGRQTEVNAVRSAAAARRYPPAHADRPARHRQNAPGAAGRRRATRCLCRWRVLRGSCLDPRSRFGARRDRARARLRESSWPPAGGARAGLSARQAPAAAARQFRAPGSGRARRGGRAGGRLRS